MRWGWGVGLFGHMITFLSYKLIIDGFIIIIILFFFATKIIGEGLIFGWKTRGKMCEPCDNESNLEEEKATINRTRQREKRVAKIGQN